MNSEQLAILNSLPEETRKVFEMKLSELFIEIEKENKNGENESDEEEGVEIEGVILSLVEIRRLYSRYATEKDKKSLGRDIFEDEERIADEELDSIYSDWSYSEIIDLLYDWINERIEPDTALVWDASGPVLVLYPDQFCERSLRRLEEKTGKRAVNIDKYVG